RGAVVTPCGAGEPVGCSIPAHERAGEPYLLAARGDRPIDREPHACRRLVHPLEARGGEARRAPTALAKGIELAADEAVLAVRPLLRCVARPEAPDRAGSRVTQGPGPGV